MHELSLCQAIVDTVQERASGRALRRIDVRIGYLRQVVPEALQFSWQVITEGTDIEGCVLEVEHVPAVIRCSRCSESSQLDVPLLVCPRCEGCDVEITAGEEFQIASIDVAEERVR